MFADALARVAFGGDEAEETPAVASLELAAIMTEMREVVMSSQTSAEPMRGLVVEGLTVVTEGHGTPVVEDISFRGAGRAGHGAGR